MNLYSFSVPKNDEVEKRRLEMWEEVWSELVPGAILHRSYITKANLRTH